MSANVDERRVGGEGGIRTPDTVTRMPHFECGAFNHSATSPWPQKGQISPSVGGYVSNARRLNKSVVLTQIGHYRSSVARSRQNARLGLPMDVTRDGPTASPRGPRHRG